MSDTQLSDQTANIPVVVEQKSHEKRFFRIVGTFGMEFAYEGSSPIKAITIYIKKVLGLNG